MEIYIEHFLAGLMFATSGAYAKGWCRHRWHQVTVGIVLVALETALAVTIIG